MTDLGVPDAATAEYLVFFQGPGQSEAVPATTTNTLFVAVDGINNSIVLVDPVPGPITWIGLFGPATPTFSVQFTPALYYQTIDALADTIRKIWAAQTQGQFILSSQFTVFFHGENEPPGPLPPPFSTVWADAVESVLFEGKHPVVTFVPVPQIVLFALDTAPNDPISIIFPFGDPIPTFNDISEQVRDALNLPPLVPLFIAFPGSQQRSKTIQMNNVVLVDGITVWGSQVLVSTTPLPIPSDVEYAEVGVLASPEFFLQLTAAQYVSPISSIDFRNLVLQGTDQKFDIGTDYQVFIHPQGQGRGSVAAPTNVPLQDLLDVVLSQNLVAAMTFLVPYKFNLINWIVKNYTKVLSGAAGALGAASSLGGIFSQGFNLNSVQSALGIVTKFAGSVQ